MLTLWIILDVALTDLSRSLHVRPSRDDGAGATWLGDLALSLLALALSAWALARAFAPQELERRSDAFVMGSIARLEGDVRMRPADALVWSETYEHSPVSEGDSLFAARSSSATVALGDEARLTIGESSLVVLRRSASDKEGDGPLLSVEVVRGHAQASAGTQELAVRLSGRQLRASKGSVVSLDAPLEGASVVTVEKGRVQLSATGGTQRTLEAGARHVLASAQTGEAVAAVVRKPPRVKSPAAGSTVHVSAREPLRIEWEESEVELSAELYDGSRKRGLISEARALRGPWEVPVRVSSGRVCVRTRVSGLGADSEAAPPHCFTVDARVKLEAPRTFDPHLEVDDKRGAR